MIEIVFINIRDAYMLLIHVLQKLWFICSGNFIYPNINRIQMLKFINDWRDSKSMPYVNSECIGRNIPETTYYTYLNIFIWKLYLYVCWWIHTWNTRHYKTNHSVSRRKYKHFKNENSEDNRVYVLSTHEIKCW